MGAILLYLIFFRVNRLSRDLIIKNINNVGTVSDVSRECSKNNIFSWRLLYRREYSQNIGKVDGKPGFKKNNNLKKIR